MSRLALLAVLLVACGGGRETPDMTDNGSAPPERPGGAAGPNTVDPARNEGSPCPATGAWAQCSIFGRLDRAGLAPRLDTSRVTEPPLTATGTLLRVGNSELELYLYADAGAREREQAKLDRSAYVAYSAQMPVRPLPTLISSSNLIAILHSRNDHQRERVGDAISAGPPQPYRP